MAKINEYPLERFTFGDDDYYDIDYWDGAVYQSAKIKGSTIRAAMSGGGSILAADGQVMPADRSQDLASFKLSLRDGVFTLGTVDADFGSIFQATKDSGNTYATIKTKTNDNAALILDINTADVTGAGNKTAFIQFRDAGVSKYIFGTNTDGVANFSDNSFFISSSAQLTDYIQAIDRDTEAFVIGRQVGNPLNDNTKFLINNGNSFNTTELDNVLMLSSRDESKKWSVDKDMFFSATKIKGDSTSWGDSQLLLQDNTGTDLWDFRNNGDVHQGVNAKHFLNANIFTLDIGTVGTVTSSMGVHIDASNVFFTGANSERVLEMNNSVGSCFGLYSSGFLENISDSTSSISNFRNRANTQGLKVNSAQSILASNSFQFRESFSNSDDTITADVDNSFTQFYMTTNGTIHHWLRTGDSAAQASFFIDGIGGRGFNVGSGNSIGAEKISLQDDTLIGVTGSKVGFMGTAPIVQVTTAVPAATFVANTSGIADDTATFDGYTIGQIVKALRNYGILA